MKYRSLGKTGLQVSEVGMGTWQLAGKPWGWDAPDENESMKALYRFVELGGNFIDTAWVYGRVDEPGDEEGGHCSEELIGNFIKESGNRNKVIIASKIPGKNRKWPALLNVPISEVFPKGYIEEMVDSSLKSLQIDSLDLMQFHVWQDQFSEENDWKEEIQNITKKGKVKHWGISINDYQPSNCLKTLDTGLIDTIQFIFNIFHQKPTEKLFPYAKEHNIGLIARVPRDEGGLAGKLTLDSTFTDDMRSKYFSKERLQEFIPRIKKLEQLLGNEARTLPELALKYILSFDEVSTVIPGTRKVKYVDENVAVSNGQKLSKELMTELKKYVWERNFYVDLDPALEKDGYIEI
ncbi:aldo/keto reductase [Candidatus Shapirobacteria bacterium CG_4_8_14_3_um_filter_35_11]|uniref:Aldo/keto reductase n=3 Tax=Candidatus Shapironibacteriota TaxID=1752721 RepID=A0A2M8GIV9_9BACT|nr:MAG: aldo/keto reductase [Candidatus Shapirobacteria bacterium CG_4_8_14_3_um_filter_35_11]